MATLLQSFTFTSGRFSGAGWAALRGGLTGVALSALAAACVAQGAGDSTRSITGQTQTIDLPVAEVGASDPGEAVPFAHPIPGIVPAGGPLLDPGIGNGEPPAGNGTWTGPLPFDPIAHVEVGPETPDLIWVYPRRRPPAP